MNKGAIFFIVAVLVQLGVLAAVPARKIHVWSTGKTVTIETAPYDPYSIMSGYYVRLTFDISRPSVSRNWTSWPEGRVVWVVLEADQNAIWDVVSVHDVKPDSLTGGTVLLRGKISSGRMSSGRIVYGIEEYFIPEDMRTEIERALRDNAGSARAQIKIDSSGNAAIVRLIVAGKVYEY